MIKEIKIRKTRIKSSIFRCFLDSPKRVTNFNQKEITVAGWVVQDSKDEITLLLGKDKEYPLNVHRPDVIKHVCPDCVDKSTLCGFKYSVQINGSHLNIGFRTKGSVEWNFSIIAEETGDGHKVLIGKKNWLFLNNDTNRSISQFKGELKISPESLEKYNIYFENVRGLSHKYNFKWSFSVAPAKEFMLEEFYPYKKGDTTVLEQVTDFSREYKEINLFFDKLKENSCLAYWKGDTHWTDYGAFIAVEYILQCFGINFPKESLNVNFSIKASSGGDLSNKLSFQINNLMLMKADNMHIKPDYYNGIVNHGSVKVFINKQPLIDKTCIIFAGSSAAWMVKFLSKVFKRLISIYTAGSIDESIIEYEKPDYVIVNMNSRFLLRPPSTELDFPQAVINKINNSATKQVVNKINESYYENMKI